MALLRHTNTFFMQRPPIIPTLLFCLVTIVIYKYNNVNYALFLCSLGRLTHCRSQFSLFLPVLRFASSATGGAQLRTSTVRLNVGVCTVPKCSPAGEPLGYATLCVNSPLRCIPHSGRSAPAPSPANLAGQDRPGKIENNRMAKKKNSPLTVVP